MRGKNPYFSFQDEHEITFGGARFEEYISPLCILVANFLHRAMISGTERVYSLEGS